MLKTKIDELLVSVSNYFDDKLIFENSQNKHAVVAEIQSNLTVYLRSNEFLDDMKKFKIVPDDATFDSIVDEIVFENNSELIEKIIELSFINNLTINRVSANKKEIDCIANSQVNTLSAADGIQFVDGDTEVIASYASTSYETKKKDSKILDEINSSLNLFASQDSLSLLNIMSKYKTFIYNKVKSHPKLTFLEKLIEISEIQKDILSNIKKLNLPTTQDKTRETILKKVFKDIYQKNYTFEECLNLKKSIDDTISDIDKKIKISISDTMFNTKEMFKIFLEIRDKIKSGAIKSLVLENIKTNTTVVFNKERLKMFNKIFGEKFETLQNVFIAKEHYSFKESSLLEKLFNEGYINHFNLNAKQAIDNSFMNMNYDELKTKLSKNSELKNFIIEKSYNENYQQLTDSYFSELFNHLKNIKVFYDVQNVFEVENDVTFSNTKFLEEIKGIFKITSESDELDIVLVLKFIKETYDMNKNDVPDLNKHVLSLVTYYLVEQINYLIKNNFLTPEQISVIKDAMKNNFVNSDLLYVLGNDSGDDKIFIQTDNLLLDYSSNDDIVQEMSYGSILSALNLDNEFLEKIEGEDRISELYFKDFIEKNKYVDEDEKNKLVANFLDKTFGGNEMVAVEHAINDTIVETQLTHLQNQLKKRTNNFFTKNSGKKEKQIIIVVDYDNDGTLAKIAAERLKDDFLKGLGNSYKNSNNVHVIYTQNANGVRGLTENDVVDVIKTFSSGKKDILLITADNGTSNIEEINKILSLKDVTNDKGKKVEVSFDNVLITDHHPMIHKEESTIKAFYAENNDKVFLFNPEYVYTLDENKNYILTESHLKQISGAASFISAFKFLAKDDKKTVDYLESISKISNIIDYVDIEHAEISNQGFVNEIMGIAKRVNLFQKFSIYFKNTLDTFNEKDFSSKERFIEKIEKLPEPLNNLNLIFIRNFLENNVYFDDLFSHSVKDKKMILKNLSEELKNIQSDYLRTIFKDESLKDQDINPNVVRLIKIFNDNTFSSILDDFKQTIAINTNNGTKTPEFNIQTVNTVDKNGNRLVMFIDKSVPEIPRKLLMDLVRSQINTYKGIYLFGAIHDGVFEGSARVNGKFVLTDFVISENDYLLSPEFAGHTKAAGFKISESDVEKIISLKNPTLSIKEDTESKVQNFLVRDVRDLLETLSSTNIINNKKTGGLEFKYLISFDDIKNVGISIEHFYSVQLGKLNGIDNEKGIPFKDAIKSHKSYQIIMDYKTNLKLNVRGTQLLEIISLLDKKKPFHLEFKYFNNLFMLDSIVTKKEFKTIQRNQDVFHFEKKYPVDSKDVIEYKQKLDDLRLVNGHERKNNFVTEKLIYDTNKDTESNVLYYEIDVEKLKSSKKQHYELLPFLNEFKDVLNSFGFYKGELSDVKNIKEFISNLENYYHLLYKESGKINFVITDTETNGLQSPLTQVGFVSLEGKIVNGKWTLSTFKNFTTVIKYDENFGVSPAIKELTKIDEKLLTNYGTQFNHLGKVLLPLLPKKEDSVLIAHNLPFDSGILKKHTDEEFADYVRNIKKMDTARISRELNTAGSYQLMTKLFITDDQVKEPLYLGIIPDNINSINAKITNKMKNGDVVLDFVTIKGVVITWQNDKITQTFPNGTSNTYYGRIVPKDGSDTRLFAVEQNIFNMFLLQAKEKFKESKSENLDTKFFDAIKGYIENEVLSGNWKEVESSGKVSKKTVIDIVNRHFITPNYTNSLLLPLNKRKVIWNKIMTDISLFINFNRMVDNSKLAYAFMDIYSNDSLSDLEKIKEYKTKLVPVFDELNKNDSMNTFFELIKKIDGKKIDEDQMKAVDYELLKLGTKSDVRYPELETFILKVDNIKKMANTIFEKDSDLNFVYNNARQHKEFFKLFVKDINDIDDKFVFADYSKDELNTKIKNYLQNNSTFNGLRYISFNDKVELFTYLLKLNTHSNFRLSIHELHNNFNPAGDVALESLILPAFYLERLKDYTEKQQSELISKIFEDSNITDLSANLRKTMLNTATNQLMYFLNITDDNIVINSDNTLTLSLRSGKYNVNKIITFDDINTIFPTEAATMVKTILSYNVTNDVEEKSILKDELYMMFMFNNSIDLSMNFELKKLDDKIKTISYLNKLTTELELLDKSLKIFDGLDGDLLNVVFELFKKLHKDLVNQDLENKETEPVFGGKDLQTFKRINNKHIESIVLKENDKKCVVTLSEEVERDSEEQRKMNIKKEFKVQNMVTFIQRIARINSLMPRNDEEKQFDIESFSSVFDLKDSIQRLYSDYSFIRQQIVEVLGVSKIEMENIKSSVINFNRGYEKSLVMFQKMSSREMDKDDIELASHNLAKIYLKHREMFIKSDDLSQKLYSLTGMNNGNQMIDETKISFKSSANIVAIRNIIKEKVNEYDNLPNKDSIMIGKMNKAKIKHSSTLKKSSDDSLGK